jgi:hypothetical protein
VQEHCRSGKNLKARPRTGRRPPGAEAFTIDVVPVEALRQQLETSTDPLEQSFAGLMLRFAAGDAIDPAITGPLARPHMRSMQDFIAAQLAAARA